MYMTVKDVADHFKVNPRTVERWVATGELQAVRPGPKIIRVHPTALEAFEAKLCPTTDSNDPSSTASNPPDGTSSGARRDARIVNLRARRTG